MIEAEIERLMKTRAPKCRVPFYGTIHTGTGRGCAEQHTVRRNRRHAPNAYDHRGYDGRDHH